mgnify:CR=1 FL=1
MKNPTDASKGSNNNFPRDARLSAKSTGISHVDRTAAKTKPGMKYGILPISNLCPSTFILLFAIIAHNGTMMTQRMLIMIRVIMHQPMQIVMEIV